MNNKDFFSVYLPALKESLANDTVNYGFFVKGPDYYINEKYLNEMEDFIEKNKEYAYFFDMIGIYFDAKSHCFDKIDGIGINIYKNKIENIASSIDKS